MRLARDGVPLTIRTVAARPGAPLLDRRGGPPRQRRPRRPSGRTADSGCCWPWLSTPSPCRRRSSSVRPSAQVTGPGRWQSVAGRCGSGSHGIVLGLLTISLAGSYLRYSRRTRVSGTKRRWRCCCAEPSSPSRRSLSSSTASSSVRPTTGRFVPPCYRPRRIRPVRGVHASRPLARHHRSLGRLDVLAPRARPSCCSVGRDDAGASAFPPERSRPRGLSGPGRSGVLAGSAGSHPAGFVGLLGVLRRPGRILQAGCAVPFGKLEAGLDRLWTVAHGLPGVPAGLNRAPAPWRA